MNIRFLVTLCLHGALGWNILDWHGVNIPGLSFQADDGLGGVLGGGPKHPNTSSLDPWIALNATMFRFPVLWNYIQPKLQGDLDTTVLNTLDSLIKYVTKNGSYAILDVHNYARLNGTIIGQEKARPFTYDFADLWEKLAKHYAANEYVMFGLMNEPHHLDMIEWGRTIQYVVDHIRQNATATKQYILISGTNWGGIKNWVTDSQPGIGNVSDTFGRLLFDVHKYFDDDGGSDGVCHPFNKAEFESFTSAMRQLKSRAIFTEIGGKANAGCNRTLNAALAFLENNYDVFLGWTIWGAGLDHTESTYINPLDWNVSRTEQHVNIVRDVVVPHMQSSSMIIKNSAVQHLAVIMPVVLSLVLFILC